MLLGIIILGNLGLIRKKEEERIIGLGNSQMCMKASLKVVKEMEGELSGGLMEVGMKEILSKVFSVDMELCIDKVVINSMKECGRMVCLTVKELNFLIMDKDMKDISNRINSTVRVYFTRTTRLYTEYGKTTNYQ